MPTFDIVKKSVPSNSFRVNKIRGMFDFDAPNIEERFTGVIDDLPAWSIGLIYGNSGTGKTTIAKQLFSDHLFNGAEYNAASCVDDMPADVSHERIVSTFNSVGFSSVPSWFKPYSVLSNGEKMRVDLAYAILSDSELFAFDEFTSVVDRTVAKIGSYAIQKAVRKTKKKFIAITCHEDVRDWLLPDWTFCTNSMVFSDLSGQKKNRPGIEIEIRKIAPTERDEVWRIFRKHHYLTHNLNKGCCAYVAYCNGELAGFLSVIHFPHPKARNIKKVHRLVILPDFQGVGIGKIVLDKCASFFEGYRYTITTSNPALMYSLKRDSSWFCYDYGINAPHGGTLKAGKFGQKRRVTSSWEKH
jgi:hypothetical protein